MNDNIFDNLEPVHMPSLDLTRSFELAKSVQAHMDESQRHMEQISRSAYEERRRTQEAIERTAENTAQILLTRSSELDPNLACEQAPNYQKYYRSLSNS